MYINPQSLKPTKKTFFITMFASVGLSLAIIFNPETVDALTAGYWLLVGSLLYSLLGLLVIFGGKSRDYIFGLNRCPHCDKLGWTIKDKLKISDNDILNLGRCGMCNEKGSISKLYAIPFLGIFVVWVLLIAISDSLSIAFFAAYLWAILCLFYFARFASIKK